MDLHEAPDPRAGGGVVLASALPRPAVPLRADEKYPPGTVRP